MIQFLKDYVKQWNLEQVGTQIMGKMVSFLLLAVFFYLAKKLTKQAVKRLIAPSIKLTNKEKARQETILRLVENFFNYVLYFIVLYSILMILGLSASSLLAGAGIAGVALGMGAQGFLSDLVNGFFILLEHQFDVGDKVRLTNGPINLSGVVVSVGIRTTQVRDGDGTLHFIPNRNILVVSNQSRGDMRASIALPLSPTVDLQLVKQTLQAVHEREVPKHPEIKKVVLLGPQLTEAGQFVYKVHLFVSDGQEALMYHRFYALYQQALLEKGIEWNA